MGKRGGGGGGGAEGGMEGGMDAFRRLPTWRKDVVNQSLEFDRLVQALDDTSQFGLAVRR